MTADTPNLEAITSETALSRWPIGSVEREVVACARAELAALKAREERMRKALRQIRDHEHREMWSQGGAYRPASTPAETYKEGVQDGHRCAALIARAALAPDAGGEGTP